MQLRFHSFPLNCSNVHFSYQRRRAADGELALRLQNLVHSVITQICHSLPASCPHSTYFPFALPLIQVVLLRSWKCVFLQHLGLSEGGPRAWKLSSQLSVFLWKGKKQNKTKQTRFNSNAQQSWCPFHSEYISSAWADLSQRSVRLPFRRYRALVSFCIPLSVFPE